MRKMAVAAVVVLGLSGCATVGGPGVSTYYECDRGTRLKVDFVDGAALVAVNGAKPMKLASDVAASGALYRRQGHELHTKGDTARWTVGRMAAEQCRQVVLPR